MPDRFLAAAIQMHATADKAANVARASALIEQAAEQGAQLVVLPEFFFQAGSLQQVVEAAESIPGPTSEKLGELADQHALVLVAGSICERAEISGKGYNTSLLFAPDGQLVSQYRKLHLFDVNLPGELSNEESRWIVPGEELVVVETPLGVIGQATCYDLRFPELFRRLADYGMQVLAFPSAFSLPTGRAHWEVLLRARAVENQVFIVAANQYGPMSPHFTCYGHSMIVDPWGRILAEAPEDGDAVLTAEIDLALLEKIRARLPVLKHRRAFESDR